MLIYEYQDYKVRQHPHLDLYYIYRWQLGDNSHSYDQHYDYFCVKVLNSIIEVNNYFIKNVWDK